MRYPSFWQRRGLVSNLLAPLGWLVCRIAARRRQRARLDSETEAVLKVPVVVIGNITVGGTGKTPLLMALVEALREHGLCVGVVSRGYGARIGAQPVDVADAAKAAAVGDEPWLIHQQTGAPVMAHPDRLLAARSLVERYPDVDLILSDDGLQHHRLPRAVEIVVVDGERRFGNGRCLPAGPLREPLSTLDSVDYVVVNGSDFSAGQWCFSFELDTLHDLAIPDGAPQILASMRGRDVEAIAAIGNPGRFFNALRDAGLKVRSHALGDHRPVDDALRSRLLASGHPILMTTKDAVKWPREEQQPGRVYAVGGQVVLPEGFVDELLGRLPGRRHS